MKTTIELPDKLLDQTKKFASARGKTFRQVLIDALSHHVLDESQTVREPGWRPLVGALSDYKEEVDEVQKYIDEEFSKVDLDTWK